MLQKRMAPAKRHLRRTVQVVALVGTLVVGIIALALIVSQTPLFRDWLRKYVVRQAGQYVNGTVSIGSLGGNLFYGVELGDIAECLLDVQANAVKGGVLRSEQQRLVEADEGFFHVLILAELIDCSGPPMLVLVKVRKHGVIRSLFESGEADDCVKVRDDHTGRLAIWPHWFG
jgi:hypothetical protein